MKRCDPSPIYSYLSIWNPKIFSKNILAQITDKLGDDESLSLKPLAPREMSDDAISHYLRVIGD